MRGIVDTIIVGSGLAIECSVERIAGSQSLVSAFKFCREIIHQNCAMSPG